MSYDEESLTKEAEERVEPTIVIPDTASAVVDIPVEPTPIDGGPRAWLQVFGAFILTFNIWGYTFAFGSFENYYVTDYLRGSTPSAIAWIGGIQTYLLITSGVVAGPLFDLGYFKPLMFGGALLGTFGAFMLSLSTKYWQIFMSQGLCIGFGSGVLFVPSMALVTRSFQKRRSLAVGAMSCGAPVGSIIYTFIFERLLVRIGFAWTARSMAFFMLGTNIIAFPLLLWGTTNTGRISSNTKRKLFDKSALTDVAFWSYALATSTQFLAYLIPYFYMPTFAQTVLGTSTSVASYCLVISQAASIPGRIVAALAANKVGVMVPWVTCALISGIMCLVWTSIHTLNGFLAFCALYGCFSGALIPLPPSIFPKVVTDPRVLGTRFGMAQGVSGIANAVGPPIAGALLKVHSAQGRNWLAAQLFAGFVMIFACLQLLGLWTLLVRKRGTVLFV